MKFNVQRKSLYAAVSAVSKVINSKNSLAVLNNFLLTLKDDTLTITASDIENTLMATVPVMESEGDGAMCVDARRLLELLKSLPDVGITINIDEDTKAAKLTFNGDKGNYDFVASDGIEYPRTDVEVTEGAAAFTIGAEQMLKGMEYTVFAVGSDTLRPMMMGVFFDVRPDSVTFVATDTRKLVKYRTSNVLPDITVSCIIPTKPAQVLRSVLSGEEGDLSISIDANRMLVRSESLTFSCQLIKGNFPDYDKVIPKNNPYILTLDRELFLTSMRRTAAFGDQGQNLAKLRITPSEITIKTFDQNYCTSAMESVACDFNHDEMVIGFSSQYVVEIFSVIPSEEVTVSLSDPSRPGVFTPSEQPEGAELVMLLMPMNVMEF